MERKSNLILLRSILRSVFVILPQLKNGNNTQHSNQHQTHLHGRNKVIYLSYCNLPLNIYCISYNSIFIYFYHRAVGWLLIIHGLNHVRGTFKYIWNICHQSMPTTAKSLTLVEVWLWTGWTAPMVPPWVWSQKPTNHGTIYVSSHSRVWRRMFSCHRPKVLPWPKRGWNRCRVGVGVCWCMLCR